MGAPPADAPESAGRNFVELHADGTRLALAQATDAESKVNNALLNMYFTVALARPVETPADSGERPLVGTHLRLQVSNDKAARRR